MFALRLRRVWTRYLLAISAALSSLPAQAQFPWSPQPSGPVFELNETLQLDEVPSAAKKQFEQAQAFLDNEQWPDAIELFRRMMETHGDKVVAVDRQRYLNVRDYCQLRLASLPPAALASYRKLADPQAKQWYEQGLAQHDAALLEKVVTHAFCTSWGDAALWALGEMALETGELHKARNCWERLLTVKSRPEGLLPRLIYPDTDIPQADIHARLILLALLLGAKEQAQWHQQQLGPLLSVSTGRLAGRQGNYAALLDALQDSIVPETTPPTEPDWSTFAGSPRRQQLAAHNIDLGAVLWRQPLKYPAPPAEYKSGIPSIAEMAKTPLSYHPVIVRERVFLLTKLREDEVDRSKYVQDLLVFDLKTGKPAWGESHLQLPVGQHTSNHHTAPLGTPRFTLTASGNRLFARIGNPVTSVHSGNQFIPLPQSLVCLDTEQEGKILWTVAPPEDDPKPQTSRAAFEGAPVCDGANVYIGVRSGGDVRPQAAVACYDAQNGSLRWKRLIVAAESPGQGQIDEITHNLLTLDGQRLYYNTNLGAVAALDARDGQLIWVYRYPRAKQKNYDEVPQHFARDLNPCVVARGCVFVAPSDSEGIFALDAEFGEKLWDTELAPSVTHLLGVVNGMLVASGNGLWFFRAEPKLVAAGRDTQAWQEVGKVLSGPQSNHERIGFGRGLIAGDFVYFPTQNAIWVFDTRGGEPRKVREIELFQTRGARPGNLSVAQGHLLITTHDEVFAFEQIPGPAPSRAE